MEEEGELFFFVMDSRSRQTQSIKDVGNRHLNRQRKGRPSGVTRENVKVASNDGYDMRPSAKCGTSIQGSLSWCLTDCHPFHVAATCQIPYYHTTQLMPRYQPFGMTMHGSQLFRPDPRPQLSLQPCVDDVLFPLSHSALLELLLMIAIWLWDFELMSASWDARASASNHAYSK
ncbi:hypothetical protein Nepgr_021126 [Nepenthes gracilis]|uniref:Uncharacterized protein n=1 Tax=Nepenthes gracilis TaxID=150966 RepID=A0AAD3SY39_NEPGR|nr:hypothetical protein Nepgr_021126 [Nepenthes gracilis]